MAQSRPHDGPLNILIVEDESMIALELEMMIEDFGHRVAGIAGRPQQAIGLIESLDTLDGAFLDANLGGQSSLEVATRLRARKIPFVVVSGYSMSELQKLGFSESGVQKPYGSRQVGKALANFETARAVPAVPEAS